MYDLRSSSLAVFADVVVMQISINTSAEGAAPAPPPSVSRDAFVKKYVAYMRKKQKQRQSRSYKKV